MARHEGRTDAELVDAARRGDREAFGELTDDKRQLIEGSLDELAKAVRGQPQAQ